jgi:ribosomal protein L16 Arg81 hydroxylase
MIGSNHNSVIVRNGQGRILSDEADELLRMYETLDLKRRIKLLKLAAVLEEELKNNNQNAEN